MNTNFDVGRGFTYIQEDHVIRLVTLGIAEVYYFIGILQRISHSFCLTERLSNVLPENRCITIPAFGIQYSMCVGFYFAKHSLSHIVDNIRPTSGHQKQHSSTGYKERYLAHYRSKGIYSSQ